MPDRKAKRGDSTENLVGGPGGPTVTPGGVMPGGAEMETWKQPSSSAPTNRRQKKAGGGASPKR